MRLRSLALLLATPALAAAGPPSPAPTTRAACPATLEALGAQLWAFRARTQPFSADDIPRIERPPGLHRSWSQRSVEAQRAERGRLQSCLETLAQRLGKAASIHEAVDLRLLGSTLARVRWELELHRRWQRDPTFYAEQALTPVLELLVQPPPLSEARSRELIARLDNVPSLMEEAKANLGKDAVAPFAQLALSSLADIRAKLSLVATQVGPLMSGDEHRARLPAAADAAAGALESFRAWLEARAPAMAGKSAVGPEAYAWFLRHVALVPYSTGQLLAMSAQEWERSVAAEALEQNRNRGVPELNYFATLQEQIARYTHDELAVRAFLEQRRILSVPPAIRHYTVRPIPGYLDALGDFGEQDDFTGPSRLDEDAVRWLYPPSPKLGYFGRANARDPRPNLTHEGVPGHYFQLALSWHHPDPIRRHYYDSGANEGIGFYAEEMMMQEGLYDESPRSREIIWGFSRLRAARVAVDVKLATGELTLDEAAEYLSQRAPMDPRAARAEAASFSTNPGQAMSYQIGKLQIEKLLAEARHRLGSTFDLRTFQDSLWLNGNVPIALQRFELLGVSDELEALDREQ